MKCIVCQENSEATGLDYCRSHDWAFESMKQAFAGWQKAYGSTSVQDFLNRVIDLSETGPKAREIAEFLRENPGRWT